MSDKKRCSEDVPDGSGWRWHQCKRYEWKDGFCKQHHPDTKAERDRKKQEVFDKRMAESPFRLKAQIIELEQQLEESKEENRTLRLYLKPHYTDGRIEAALKEQDK